MRKSEWSAIVMAMILPAVLFTASCTKKMVKTEAAQTVQSEVPRAPDNLARSASGGCRCPGSCRNGIFGREHQLCIRQCGIVG
jgi:hypothetical protein